MATTVLSRDHTPTAATLSPADMHFRIKQEQTGRKSGLYHTATHTKNAIQ